jgi:hypothetical protein
MFGNVLEALLGNAVDHLLGWHGKVLGGGRNPQAQSGWVHFPEPRGQLTERGFEAQALQHGGAERRHQAPQLGYRSLGDGAGLRQAWAQGRRSVALDHLQLQAQ